MSLVALLADGRIAVATTKLVDVSATAAPATTEASATTGATGDEDITVGFSVYDMQYGFFQDMEKGTSEAAEADGWEFVPDDEKSDENEMVTGAQALLNQGIDVLIISPFKPDALGPIIAKAKELGLPVIVDDIGGGGTPYDAIVISDNEGAACRQPTSWTSWSRRMARPARRSSRSPVSPPRCTRHVATSASCAGSRSSATTSSPICRGHSKAEEAYKIMKDALAKDPDVAGVFACNDPMAVAASNAIIDSGKDPIKDIVTVGFNGDPEALTAIDTGKLSGSIAQDPEGMGALTVDLAAKVLNGETIEFGNVENREVYEDVTLITKDNVADFLD